MNRLDLEDARAAVKEEEIRPVLRFVTSRDPHSPIAVIPSKSLSFRIARRFENLGR